MNDKLIKFSSLFNGAFKSQDSKFFIITAAKITIIPVLAFSLVFYALWTFMEMNYNFFVSSGFMNSPELKEAFYDTIFGKISPYLVYFGFTTIGVFMLGLLVSHFALRAFEDIEDHVLDLFEYEDNEEVPALVSEGLNKYKLIYQISAILFKYIDIYKKKGKAPKIHLPEELLYMTKPKLDKVFMTQYLVAVSIIIMGTSFLLYTFTNELYFQIVQTGLSILDSNKQISTFLTSQESLLGNIYSMAIAFNIFAYLLISKNIIKAVDGVTYGFTRDIVSLMQGNHNSRLRPRLNDPGKNFALTLNEYLDETLAFTSELTQTDDKFTHEQNKTASHNLELIKNNIDQVADDELPPPFIEKQSDSNIFTITTSKGLKLDNVDKETLLEIIKEIESKKVA